MRTCSLASKFTMILLTKMLYKSINKIVNFKATSTWYRLTSKLWASCMKRLKRANKYNKTHS